jgi:hypothetical protein
LSILSEFENRIGRALEGGFAHLFRTPVQPAELARRAGREMDRGKKLGVGKVYAPTLYTILLSQKDDQSLGGFADTLAGELETYLIGYAREHSYELAARPTVRFLVDTDLKLGRFDVIGELLSPEELAAELGYNPDDDPYETPRDPRQKAAVGAQGAAPEGAVVAGAIAVGTPAAAVGAGSAAGAVFDAEAMGVGVGSAGVGASVGGGAPAAVIPAEASPTELLSAARPMATVTVRGLDHDVVLQGDRAVVGRLSACEINLPDSNTSREHAAFERNPDGTWWIRDLGSTNGTSLNGTRITSRQQLNDGDLIAIGVTELVFHEPRG